MHLSLEEVINVLKYVWIETLSGNYTIVGQLSMRIYIMLDRSSCSDAEYN